MTRSRTNPLLPLLALGLTLGLAASARAQDRQYQSPSGTAASLRITFGAPLHWAAIRGTRVEELPATERSDFDRFRYGGTYYAYSNNRWYSSPQERGDYTAIDDRAVPSDFSNIPRDHWRNYPSGWQDRRDSPRSGLSASLRVNIGDSNHWMGIHGTQVEELPAAERPSYDVFRYGGQYYAHDNDRWYRSHEANGDFTAMDDREVPEEFSTIPRDHWRTYPSDWQDRHGRGGDDRYSTMQINLGYATRWSMIRGTRVQMVRGRQRPDFDLFRFGGDYYAFDSDHWYTSHSGRGEYTRIGDRMVPDELRRVPRMMWRNYPPRWLSENGDSRWDRYGRNPYAGRDH